MDRRAARPIKLIEGAIALFCCRTQADLLVEAESLYELELFQ